MTTVTAHCCTPNAAAIIPSSLIWRVSKWTMLSSLFAIYFPFIYRHHYTKYYNFVATARFFFQHKNKPGNRKWWRQIKNDTSSMPTNLYVVVFKASREYRSNNFFWPDERGTRITCHQSWHACMVWGETIEILCYCSISMSDATLSFSREIASIMFAMQLLFFIWQQFSSHYFFFVKFLHGARKRDLGEGLWYTSWM